MAALTLTMETYRDKVLGAWQGKSAGVTLGAGLRGQMVPGRYNFYSPVPGQPAASPAIDFSLVWLTALEEAGPEITPEDLAVAWLEHLDYAHDEFGYAALNLRRGLPPPASGAHSNWFRHATGGMMRADFWAVVAPGTPQVAAAYAYHDAKIDHSEDGVWAAMFYAALASAAFFLNDPFSLLTIGLAMIPRTCRTARAVKTALAAAQRGAGWMEARESVQHEVGHRNFTDSPQNAGFFTIGLLYGQGQFGPSLCAGANCGYDASTVAGMLGALYGIAQGRTGLPEEWMRPLGDVIIPGNGMRDHETPATASEVAVRMAEQGARLVRARCPDIALQEIEAAAPARPFLLPDFGMAPPPPIGDTPGLPPTLSATSGSDLNALPVATHIAPLPPAPWETPDEAPTVTPDSTSLQTARAHASSAGTLAPQPAADLSPQSDAPGAEPPFAPLAPDPISAVAWADNSLVKPLLVASPVSLSCVTGPFEVLMDAHDSMAVAFGSPRTISFTVYNRSSQPFTGKITVYAPAGWQVTPPTEFGQRQYIAAHTGVLRGDFVLRAPESAARIEIANAITLRLTPEDGKLPMDAEFVLMGASCWWTVGPFANFDGEGFDRSYAPEDRPGINESFLSRGQQMVRWERWAYPESTLYVEPLFKGTAGVCYGQTIVRSKIECMARLVANTNSGVKVWLNGELVLRRYHRETFRPLLGGGPWAVDVLLRAGDNPVMVKWVRGADPYDFSLTFSDRAGRGLPEVGNTSW